MQATSGTVEAVFKLSLNLGRRRAKMIVRACYYVHLENGWVLSLGSLILDLNYEHWSFMYPVAVFFVTIDGFRVWVHLESEFEGRRDRSYYYRNQSP